MNAFQKLAMAFFAVLLMMSAGAAYAAQAPKGVPASSEVVESPWTQRCSGEGAKRSCEVFHRLEMKDSHMRVAEFAVGFPDQKDKEQARGVVILPLGVLLSDSGPDATLTIDNGRHYSFKIRYCITAGCFSYITVDKDLLKTMKKGKKVTLQFVVNGGENVKLEMKLNGFEKELKKLQ